MRDNINPKRCTHRYCDECGLRGKRKTLRKSVRTVRHTVKSLIKNKYYDKL